MSPIHDSSTDAPAPVPSDPTKVDVEGESNDRAVRVPEGVDPAGGPASPDPGGHPGTPRPTPPPPGTAPRPGEPAPTPHAPNHPRK